MATCQTDIITRFKHWNQLHYLQAAGVNDMTLCGTSPISAEKECQTVSRTMQGALLHKQSHLLDRE